jgi:hypothetical protein
MQFQLDQALEVLTTTPGVLNAMLRGKSAAWLNCRQTPEAFSPADVVGHLSHGERTNWVPRLKAILKHQDTVAFDAFDRFAFRPLIEDKSIDELLDEFAALRNQSLATLNSLQLGNEHLALPGKHPDLGAVTVSHLLATWVVHDLGHISQIVKAMANEYRDAVGPWRAYTTILN